MTMNANQIDVVEPPRLLRSPIEVIGYWCRSPLHHGPVVRFWSHHECVKLVAFVSWNAIIQRGFDVFSALEKRGAPMRKLGTVTMMFQVNDWLQELQAQSEDARMLCYFKELILTALPEGIDPPDVLVTLRPETTAHEWLSAKSTGDVRTHHALAAEKASCSIH